MKTIIALLFLFFGSSLNARNICSDTISNESYVYLSVGAPAMYGGFSYEHLVYQKNNIQILPRAGFGLNLLKPSLGREFNLHTGITILNGKNEGKVELGFGIIHYLFQEYDFNSESNKLQYRPILYGIIGYRYTFNKRPVSLKFGIAPILELNKDSKVFFPLIDFGIGIKLK